MSAGSVVSVGVGSWSPVVQIQAPRQLGYLAKRLRVYDLLWHPENLGITFCSDMEVPLSILIRDIQAVRGPVSCEYATYGEKSVSRLLSFMLGCENVVSMHPEWRLMTRQPDPHWDSASDRCKGQIFVNGSVLFPNG